MKLTYWKATALTDSDCYSIRCKTKKEVLNTIKEYYNENDYSKPIKCTIEYADAFELMLNCSCEDHHWWE